MSYATLNYVDPGTKSTIEGNMCGNGIKESGEECDCGTSSVLVIRESLIGLGPANSPECMNNSCCDGKTCKLKAGAKCE